MPATPAIACPPAPRLNRAHPLAQGLRGLVMPWGSSAFELVSQRLPTHAPTTPPTIGKGPWGPTSEHGASQTSANVWKWDKLGIAGTSLLQFTFFGTARVDTPATRGTWLYLAGNTRGV